MQYCFEKESKEKNTPFDFIVSGGQRIGYEIGWDKVRVFAPSEVSSLIREVSEVDSEFIEKNFDAEDMLSRDLFSRKWKMEYAEDTKLDLKRGIKDLGNFLERCKVKGCGFYVVLS